MSTATTDRLRSLLAPVVSAAGLDLESIDVTPAGRRRLVRIAVDKDGGISLDDVAFVSRAVSDVLDQSDVMGAQPYVLEVGSPGVDRPLVEPRHWRRAIGRLVEIELVSGGRLIGRLEAADVTGFELEVQDDDRALEKAHDRRITYSDVRTARVQVEFTRPDGPTADAGADDADDADEVE